MTEARDIRLKRLHYRAWHRGTREADYMIGGFFDTYSAGWDDSAIGWFESVIDEQDVDIMSWAFGRTDPPEHLNGPMVDALRRLDYIEIPN